MRYTQFLKKKKKKRTKKEEVINKFAYFTSASCPGILKSKLIKSVYPIYSLSPRNYQLRVKMFNYCTKETYNHQYTIQNTFAFVHKFIECPCVNDSLLASFNVTNLFKVHS